MLLGEKFLGGKDGLVQRPCRIPLAVGQSLKEETDDGGGPGASQLVTATEDPPDAGKGGARGIGKAISEGTGRAHSSPSEVTKEILIGDLGDTVPDLLKHLKIDRPSLLRLRSDHPRRREGTVAKESVGTREPAKSGPIFEIIFPISSIRPSPGIVGPHDASDEASGPGGDEMAPGPDGGRGRAPDGYPPGDAGGAGTAKPSRTRAHDPGGCGADEGGDRKGLGTVCHPRGLGPGHRDHRGETARGPRTVSVGGGPGAVRGDSEHGAAGARPRGGLESGATPDREGEYRRGDGTVGFAPGLLGEHELPAVPGPCVTGGESVGSLRGAGRRGSSAADSCPPAGRAKTTRAPARGEKARKCLEDLVNLVTGSDPLEPRLSEWMISVSPPSTETGGVD